jgi:fucose permease
LKPVSMKTLKKFFHQPSLGLILLAYVAFIALGMPDGLLGIAWPTIRQGFGIPIDALGMLFLTATSGYLFSSFVSGKLISKFQVGNVLVVSCLLTGTALIGYTLVPAWWMMVALGVLAGLGAGAIDAGLNTYIAAYFNAGMMQWLHASYGIGITMGPIIMTLSLTSPDSWRTGYRIVGIFQLLLALCFVFTLSLWARGKSASTDLVKKITEYKTPFSETLRQPSVWLSMLLFALYVGAEVSLGTWTYSLLTESRGVPTQIAGFWAGSYWATFTIGRILAGLFAKRVSVEKLVLIGTSGAIFGACLLWWNPATWTNVAAVALIGFSIAPIFPALTTGVRRRVGDRYAANTIGMQMAAGAASTVIMPSIIGVLAHRISLEVVPIVLVIVFTILLTVFLLSIRKEQSGQPVGNDRINR